MKAFEEVGQLLFELRERNPLIHQITNYVTANDCANITLAIGASPVMAEDILEVREIVSHASALVINIGTLNCSKLEAMLAAGEKANELGIPVLLDPVGVGASAFRTEAAKKILKDISLSVIRGNLSEIKTLFDLEVHSKGVDSVDIVSDNGQLLENKLLAREFSKKFNTVTTITGSIDIVTDGRTLYTVENGHEMMSKVTGTGCMCSSLIGTFLGVSGTKRDLLSALAGVVSMGISGEIAYENLEKSYEGSGSLKTRIIDAVYNLSYDHIIKRGKINEE